MLLVFALVMMSFASSYIQEIVGINRAEGNSKSGEVMVFGFVIAIMIVVALCILGERETYLLNINSRMIAFVFYQVWKSSLFWSFPASTLSYRTKRTPTQ